MITDPGKIVHTFKTKNGNEAVIRYPTINDVSEMTSYINILSSEDLYITFSGEQLSYDDEYTYIDDQIKKIQKAEVVKLICFVDGKMAGVCDVYRNLQGRRRSWHVGIFGLSVAKEFRNDGIGYELSKCTIEEAKRNIKGLRMITLSVYRPNVPAKHLYEKLGFKEFGNLPKGIWYKDTYIDEISMYLEL